MAALAEEKVEVSQPVAVKDEPEPHPPGWDLMCDESKELLYHKHIICQIKRSKNDNRVMYMANITKDGKIDVANPVTAFWLKIEPSYIEKHRKSGKKDDRTELTFMENNMAYGITVVPHNAEKTEFKITFVAMKDRPAILKIDPSDGLPKCFGQVADDKGKLMDAILKSMYVQTKENWVGLPTVNYVDLIGIRISDGKKMSQRIKK